MEFETYATPFAVGVDWWTQGFAMGLALYFAGAAIGLLPRLVEDIRL